MIKTLYITRGVSGSGKSTFADSIKELDPTTVVCCADDYFMYDNGYYDFDVNKLDEAHIYCKDVFTDAILHKVDTIVVSNTNTREWEFKEYKELAEEAGYKVIFLVLENRHGGVNVHGVPKEVTERQESSIRDSLKLSQ